MAPRTLGENCAALATAIGASRGRIDQASIEQGETVVQRVDRRLSLAGDATVVAIAGATGSGKSTLFNALSRTALAESGVQRPLTQQAMAVTFGTVDVTGLLDWLGIRRRHITAGQGLDGLVLLDLADYDSIETDHRDEVDRLVEIIDAFIWVVDPQKYADAVLHERYLSRFAGHADVMVFVLNQIDRVRPDEAAAIRADFTRVLSNDGIAHPTIYEVSAVTDAGIPALRQGLQAIVSGKKSSVSRLEADVVAQARQLQTRLGDAPGGTVGRARVAALVDALAEAAGAEEVGQAVQGSWKRRGGLATGWPLVSWIGGLKADPLKRLHLDQFRTRKRLPEATELTRTALATRTVSRARVDSAIRAVGDDAMAKLPRSWWAAVDQTMKTQSATLPDQLDQAVARTDLGLNDGRGWWGVVRALQWCVLAVTLLGLIWLGVNFVLRGYLELPGLTEPSFARLPLPTWMAIAGVVVGLALAGVSRIAVTTGAKLKAASAVRRIHKATEQVAMAQVVNPINAELIRFDQAKAALTQILGRSANR